MGSEPTAVWQEKFFLDGGWARPSAVRTLATVEKATGRELGRQALGAAADIDRAVAGAVAAQREWAVAGYDVRAALLRRVAARLTERAGEFADWIVRETGSVRGKADYEIQAATNELYEAAALASAPLAEVLPSHDTGRLSLAQRVPVGVVGVITPWNFPLVLAMRAIAPALALGNTVVLKPAELTPVTGGLLLAELFAVAPPGLLQVVTGLGEEAGEALVHHPDVPMIHFTGSSDVGRRIGTLAGGMLKKVSLELGGNNAFVVLDDADIEQASMVGAWSSFHYQGQTCITASRHIVHRSLADAYIEALARRAKAIVVGDPAADGVGLGPMISEEQRDRAFDMIDEAVRQGARIVEGGTHDGLLVRPTVITHVTTDMRVYAEEIFAPVAPIVVVDTEEQALELTNDTRYGLVNAVFTGDPLRGLAFAERVRSGMVHVNDSTCLDEAHVPFGGIGWSGSGGRSGGAANLEEFTERRWVSLQRASVSYPY